MMFSYRCTIYYLGIHLNRRDIEEWRNSGIKGQIERASGINGHVTSRSLLKRNAARYDYFRTGPYLKGFAAISR